MPQSRASETRSIRAGSELMTAPTSKWGGGVVVRGKGGGIRGGQVQACSIHAGSELMMRLRRKGRRSGVDPEQVGTIKGGSGALGPGNSVGQAGLGASRQRKGIASLV